MLTGLVIGAAAVCANLAVVLTALEARRQPPVHSLRVGLLLGLVRRPLWRLAAGLDVAGWALKTGALLVAPLTVVAPAMALGLFLLLVFAAAVLGEPVRPASLAGVAMLAGGVALVALHSPERQVTVAGPLAWSVCAGVLACGAAAAFIARRRGPAVDARLMAVSCGFAWALNGILSKLMADALASARWALLAGALAAAVGVGAVGYLAKTSALQAGPAAPVESIVAVLNALVPVALAPVLFAERWPDDAGAALQLVAGLALVALGVWLLARATAPALARARAGAAAAEPAGSPHGG